MLTECNACGREIELSTADKIKDKPFCVHCYQMELDAENCCESNAAAECFAYGDHRGQDD
jgi:hypothetical protein